MFRVACPRRTKNAQKLIVAARRTAAVAGDGGRWDGPAPNTKSWSLRGVSAVDFARRRAMSRPYSSRVRALRPLALISAR
jgi:hypothetical protein